MVNLHTPVIKEIYHPKKNRLASERLNSYSGLMNIPTESLIDNIFNDEIIRNLFIELITLIEPWVYLHANIKLVDNGHLPLIGEETINLVSRGENIINYYFNIEKNKYSKSNSFFNNIFGSASDSDNNAFFKKNSGYFKISDIDFNLNIRTNRSDRFEIIEKYVIESLVDVLNILTDGFDALYDYYDKKDILSNIFQQTSSAIQKIDQDSVESSSNNISVKNILIHYDIENLDIIKRMMAIPYFDFSSELMMHPTPQNCKMARKNNFKLIELIDIEIKQLLTVTDDIMFFPYIYYFENIAGKTLSKPFIGHEKFDAAIRNQINKYFFLLTESNLYNETNRKYVASTILSKLNNLQNNTFYTNKSKTITSPAEYSLDEFYDKIIIKPQIGIDILEILPTDSIYIYNELTDMSSFNISQSTNKCYVPGSQLQNIENIALKKHYIIIDQSIASSTRLNTMNIDYDLIKVKLNIILKNVILNNKKVNYPFPADFININIDRFNSSSYVDTVSSPYIFINLFGGDNQLPIKVSSKKILVYSLIKKLFDGEHFLPWYINNYEKELSRLLFLLNIDESEYIRFLEQLLTTNNKKELVNYKMFNKFNYDLYSFYNLIWIDALILKEYQEIKYIIKFILIMDELIILPNNELLKILKDFQSSYGWYEEDISVNNTRVSYATFRNSLLKIVNTLNKIHSSN